MSSVQKQQYPPQNKVLEPMKCRSHPYEVAELIMCDPEVTDMFKCIQCLRENPSLASKVVLVNSFLAQSSDRDILNLCNIESGLYQEAKSFVYKSNYLLDNIKDCVNKMEAKMIEMLKQINEGFISKAKSILAQKTIEMNEYNNQCGRQKMKSIIEDVNLNREQKEFQLKQLKGEINTESNREKVAEIWTKLRDLQPQISLDYADIMKDLTNIFIQKLSQSVSCGQDQNNLITGKTLPSNNNSFSLVTERTGILIVKNTGEYIGQLKEELMNGFGAFTSLKGDKFIGEWKYASLNGVGSSALLSGEKYIGEWKNNKQNGQGTLIQTNGNTYVGEFKNGHKQGQGTFTQTDGSIFVGEFKNGKCSGQGTFTRPDGSTYVGEVKDNIRNGQGITTSSNGSKYNGEYKDDKQSGQGTLTSSDGSVYVGQWKDNLRNGQGTKTWVDGKKYVGEWKDHHCSGQGIQTWPCGQRYVGQFEKHKRHGKGVLTLSNGTIKSGFWEKDQFIGNVRNALVERSQQRTNEQQRN